MDVIQSKNAEQKRRAKTNGRHRAIFYRSVHNDPIGPSIRGPDADARHSRP
jgi:hypothetical protein